MVQLRVRAPLLFGVIFVLLAGALIVSNSRRFPGATKLAPFALTPQGIFRASLTEVDRIGNVPLKLVRFADTTTETLQSNAIYLVEVGAASGTDQQPIEEIPMDTVVRNLGQGTEVNYFGYKYTSPDAALEKAHKADPVFPNRFPGVFFASARARNADASIQIFEQTNGVTFAATDASTGSVKLSANSLYILVVNEANGALFDTQNKGSCGDGWKASTEACDDGNTANGDGCSGTCQVESGWSCSGNNPSVCTSSESGLCGNGVLDPDEECDDENLSNDDSCSSLCKRTFISPAIYLTEQSVGAGTINVSPGQKDVPLLRFTLEAKQESRLRWLSIQSTTATLPLSNASIWVDANGDGVVDEKLVSTFTKDQLRPNANIDVENDARYNIPKDQDVLYEIRGDISPSATDSFNVRIQSDGAFTLPINVIWKSAVDNSYYALLGGVIFDGGNCIAVDPAFSSPPFYRGCDINATTVPSPTWNIVTCGDGQVQPGEDCDDGNQNDLDTCPNSCRFHQVDLALHDLGPKRWPANDPDFPNSDFGEYRFTVRNAGQTPVSLLDQVRLQIHLLGYPNDEGMTGSWDIKQADIESGDSLLSPGAEAVIAGYVGNHVIGQDERLIMNQRGTILIKAGTTDANPSNNSLEKEVVFEPLIRCGNGKIETGETCDDSNATDSDGCSSVCQTESGWFCEDVPSACREIPPVPFRPTVCGNGQVESGERCDDGNTATGDGCDGSCAVESSWTCTGNAPSTCTRLQVCGDGIIETGETCDDGNTTNGDGCAGSGPAACSIERGWTCTMASPSVCTIQRPTLDSVVINRQSVTVTYGKGFSGCAHLLDENGTLLHTQNFYCDSGRHVQTTQALSDVHVQTGQRVKLCNEANHDFCSDPVIVVNTCGDGRLNPGEDCDDGNSVGSDGCSNCKIVSGWTCSGEPSVCRHQASSRSSSQSSGRSSSSRSQVIDQGYFCCENNRCAVHLGSRVPPGCWLNVSACRSRCGRS